MKTLFTGSSGWVKILDQEKEVGKIFSSSSEAKKSSLDWLCCFPVVEACLVQN